MEYTYQMTNSNCMGQKIKTKMEALLLGF